MSQNLNVTNFTQNFKDAIEEQDLDDEELIQKKEFGL
jgi:hypothetical protein